MSGANDEQSGAVGFSGFFKRRGTLDGLFGQRLARARLLYLRRREVAANWLALGILVAAWHLEAFV